MNTHSRHRVRPALTSVSAMTLAVLVACLACYQLWEFLDRRWPHVALAMAGGMVAAGATALGAVPVLFSQTLSQRVQDCMFGFGAGVMLAASAFSLVAPGIAAAGAQGYGPWGAGILVGAAILLGGAVLLASDRLLPHEHFIKGKEGRASRTLRRTWLFVFAIMLHNVPEGLAIGVGYAGSDSLRGAARRWQPASPSRTCPKGWWWRWPCWPPATAVRSRWRWACCPGWSSRWAPSWARRWWAGRRRCCRGGWVSRPAPCCSSSATRSFPSRTARGMRCRPPPA